MKSINIDSLIFISFLFINFVAGLYYGRGVKNIKDYAIGNSNFSTMTIAATLVATWMSGSVFFAYITESYNNGLYFIWVTLGDGIFFLIMAYFFSLRLGEFLGKLSIAEAMGDLYGQKVRVITAIAGCIGTSGVMAAQLKVSGLLFEYSFGAPSSYGIIIGALIIGIYSAFGGIKSVTFTDVIQLFTFGTIIPTLAFFIYETLDNIDLVFHTLKTNDLFNYKEVFDFTRPKSFYYLTLFIYFIFPFFQPAIFQRIAMAKNVMQVKKSFIIAGITCFFIVSTITFIGVLVLSINPNLKTEEIVKNVIFEYSYVGLKGLTITGIMAMLMSSVDSYINSTSVLFVHDFCKPLGIRIAKDELTASRITSFAITILALLLALSGDSLLNLIILAYSFYVPVVSIPFVMAVLGFRTSTKSVLISMAVGFTTVISWKTFISNDSIDGMIPAMVANLIALMGSHYILKQPGGWVGIKDQKNFDEIKIQNKLKLSRFIKKFFNFKFIDFIKKNTPRQDYIHCTLGLFCIVSAYSNMYTIPKEIQTSHLTLINIILPSVLFLSTMIMSYPLWPQKFKNTDAIVLIWNLVIFYILGCIGLLFVFISQFSSFTLMIYMVNLIIISVLLRWNMALTIMVSSILLTTKFYHFYQSSYLKIDNPLIVDFKIGYLLVLITGILVVFLRPQQDKQDSFEKRMDLLDKKVYNQNIELRSSLKVKNEFLANISHEIRTPFTGVYSLSQSLNSFYDTLEESKRRKIINLIAINSERLNQLIENILDLSKLSSLKYELKLENLNLSEIVYERVNICKKSYLDEKDIQFILNIENDIIALCDEHYIKSVIDNLIMNAIKYSKDGKITINLHKTFNNKVNFSIQDEGIGIPKEELLSIFDVFVVSSKTHTPAGGKGVGLALCKKTIELHKGKIWAESDGEKGSTFFFTLDLK